MSEADAGAGESRGVTCHVCGRSFETAAARRAHLRSEGLVD